MKLALARRGHAKPGSKSKSDATTIASGSSAPAPRLAPHVEYEDRSRSGEGSESVESPPVMSLSDPGVAATALQLRWISERCVRHYAAIDSAVLVRERVDAWPPETIVGTKSFRRPIIDDLRAALRLPLRRPIGGEGAHSAAMAGRMDADAFSK